ncbi:MAG: hypothetical protein AAGG02_20010 [Cyanobacteria bacterium P01_H01_bin.15]
MANEEQVTLLKQDVGLKLATLVFSGRYSNFMQEVLTEISLFYERRLGENSAPNPLKVCFSKLS